MSLLKHQRNNDTIADIFRQTVSKHPQKTTFFFEQKTWKFQEVEDFANRIANYFKSQGCKKGDKVALLLESCPEFVCIWLGLSKLGVITALINTNLKRDSLWHCVSAVEVKAIIFGTDFSGTVRPSFPPFYLIIFKGLLGMKGKKRWSFVAVIIYRSLWLYKSPGCSSHAVQT